MATKRSDTTESAPAQVDPYEQGMLDAVAMLLAVVQEQRNAAWVIEQALKDQPDDKKQVLSDVLRPLSAQQQAAETIYNRVEQRAGRHLRERWRAARKAEG